MPTKRTAEVATAQMGMFSLSGQAGKKKVAAKKPAAKKGKAPAVKSHLKGLEVDVKPVAKKAARKSVHPMQVKAKKIIKSMTLEVFTDANSLHKVYHPNEALSRIVGTGPITRPAVTKAVWDYIIKRGLQDKVNKRMINTDAALQAVVGRRVISMFEMTRFISLALLTTKPKEPKAGPKLNPESGSTRHARLVKEGVEKMARRKIREATKITPLIKSEAELRREAMANKVAEAQKLPCLVWPPEAKRVMLVPVVNDLQCQTPKHLGEVMIRVNGGAAFKARFHITKGKIGFCHLWEASTKYTNVTEVQVQPAVRKSPL